MRTRTLSRISLVSILFLALAVPPASAQSKKSALPDAGSWAIGGDLGVSLPLGAGDYDSLLQWDFFFEYFQTSSVSWRGMISFFSFDGTGGALNEDLIAVNANAAYQWDGSKVVPFITGGPGLYRYSNRDESSVEFGVDFGGGANFYVSEKKKLAIKLEGVFHGTAGPEPDSFFQLSVGIRAHF